MARRYEPATRPTLLRLLVCAALAACGAKPVPRVALGGGTPPAAGSTEYVVYRFSGTLLAAPVTIRQEVVARTPGRVTIDVRATRGREERHWLQVGPDSADARWNNVADELYAVRGGSGESGSGSRVKERLPNPDNATLARLYDWALVTADSESRSHETAVCQEVLGKDKASCVCERTTRTLRGKTIHTEASRCSTFTWQRGPARWTGDGGEVLWQVDVSEVGGGKTVTP